MDSFGKRGNVGCAENNPSSRAKLYSGGELCRAAGVGGSVLICTKLHFSETSRCPEWNLMSARSLREVESASQEKKNPFKQILKVLLFA